MEEGQAKRARAPVVKTKLTKDKKFFVCPYTGQQTDRGVLGYVNNNRAVVFSSLPVYRRWLEDTLGTDHKNFAELLERTAEQYDQLPENIPATFSRDVLAGFGGDQSFLTWFAPFAQWLSINEQKGISPEQWIEAQGEQPKKSDKKKAKPEPVKYEPCVMVTKGKRSTVCVSVDDVVKAELKIAAYAKKNPEATRLSITQDKWRVEFFAGHDEGLVTQLTGQKTQGPARVVFLRKCSVQQ